MTAQQVCFTLLPLALLLQVATSTVHEVLPDSKSLDGNYTLAYYQDNGQVYFTSNTQLHFMPGIFLMKSLLTISNVANFSLVGSTSDDTVLTCSDDAAGVLIAHSDGIIIKDIAITNCSYDFSTQYVKLSHVYTQTTNMMILKCSNILIMNSLFFSIFSNGVALYNPTGNSSLYNIRFNSIVISVNNVENTTRLSLTRLNYMYVQPRSPFEFVISVIISNHSSNVEIIFSHLVFNRFLAINIDIDTCLGNNYIKINNLLVTHIYGSGWPGIEVVLINFVVQYFSTLLGKLSNTHVQFINCHFTSIFGGPSTSLINIYLDEQHYTGIFYYIDFIDSTFSDIQRTQIIDSRLFSSHSHPIIKLTIAFKDSVFNQISFVDYLIFVEHAEMLLNGFIYFTSNNNITKSLILTSGTYIKLFNYTEFSSVSAETLIYTEYILMEKNAMLNFTSNNFTIGIDTSLREKNNYLCIFQYGNDIENSANTNYGNRLKDYSITFDDNFGYLLYANKYATSHCDWLGNSVFLASNPAEINHQLIKYANNKFTTVIEDENQICLCKDEHSFNCMIDELPPVFPGQKYSLKLAVKNTTITAGVDVNEQLFTSCKSKTKLVSIFLFSENCTSLDFTFVFQSRKSCELFVEGAALYTTRIIDKERFMTFYQGLLSVYHVEAKPCPLGFTLNMIEGVCQCDSLLATSVLSVTTCDINDQTILRPANSWVSARTINDSHTYYVSLHCPFDYCLPYPSNINLSTPDSQCQFKRTGVVCGKCQHGLSTLFGSSQCKQCSNVFLLVIIPLVIAGILLVMMLFAFDLTVTIGDVNAILFYANIIGINTAVMLPSSKLTYILISLVNLDLGIETCFYNGMDDYVKMWLQFMFPLYLIIIAITLIITSRYSTRVQRLTARRALPVLATLFVLSYTKVLRTVSYVLFFYCTITEIPTKHSKVVWSVDVNTQIFGPKFTMLFVVSTVLFVVLLLFNIVLTFTRILFYFKFVSRFKPLLDAYQGPYKDKFYYWTGLQLVMRAVFFGLSALDRNTNMMISLLLIGIITAAHGVLYPFKNRTQNIQELFILLNLHALFVVSLYTTSNATVVEVLILIALIQFIFSVLKNVKNQWFKKVSKVPFTAFAKVKTYCSCFKHPKAKQGSAQIELIPEVTYNYKEFREPLIGQDN